MREIIRKYKTRTGTLEHTVTQQQNQVLALAEANERLKQQIAVREAGGREVGRGLAKGACKWQERLKQQTTVGRHSGEDGMLLRCLRLVAFVWSLPSCCWLRFIHAGSAAVTVLLQECSRTPAEAEREDALKRQLELKARQAEVGGGGGGVIGGCSRSCTCTCTPVGRAGQPSGMH